MAQRREVRVFLTDDLTGKELPEGQGRTIRFGMDGQWYEIDLADDNATELTDVLTEYIDHGRKYVVPEEHVTRRRRGGSTAKHDRDETREARAWLTEHGHLPEGSRGRIAGELWDLYRNRDNTSAPAKGEQQKIEEPAKPAAPSKPAVNSTPAKKTEAKAKQPEPASA